jgi:hypothetical protein
MIDEQQLQYFSEKYKIKYKVFPQADMVTLSTGIDDWMIKYVKGRDRPYCLYHKNKIRQTNKYHVQRWLKKFPHVLDSIVNHKKILVNLYGSRNTHKQNKNINTRRKNNYWQN